MRPGMFQFMCLAFGLSQHVNCNTVYCRAILSFLGVHKLTPVLPISGDMGWEPPNFRHIFDIRLLNISYWISEVKSLFSMIDSLFFRNRLQSNILNAQ